MSVANPPPSGAASRYRPTTLRAQLVWAAIFPLSLFSLLAILMTTSALNNIALNLILKRDTAQAKSAATDFSAALQPVREALSHLAGELSAGADLNRAELTDAELNAGLALFDNRTHTADWVSAAHPANLPAQSVPACGTAALQQATAVICPTGNGLLLLAQPISGSLTALVAVAPFPRIGPDQTSAALTGEYYLVNADGVAFAPSQPTNPNWLPVQVSLRLLASAASPSGRLDETAASGEQVVLAAAPFDESGLSIIFVEPWNAAFAPAVYYEWALAIMILVGMVLSAFMLSLSVERVIQPLQGLSEFADRLGPGSVFHPLPEEGPLELRALLHAFNQMIIRLAEQQGAVREYAAKALLSQEEERQRISHELHDETVQDLVGLIQRVDLCRSEMDKDPELARRRLDELRELAGQALDDLRRISNALRPPILQDLGLPAALQSLCDDMVRHMPGLICECTILGEPRRLAPELELAVFRVVQEALSNARWHAEGITHVGVTLEIDAGHVGAIIEDDGPGFDVPDVPTLVSEDHLGLAGMFERARLFGGKLTIDSTPGRGARLFLYIPIGIDPEISTGSDQSD
jgi:signal transduction histidine kinase